MEPTIEIATDARGVATLTLSRPEKRNALSAGMIAEVTEAARRLGGDPAVRAVVLAGAGDAFCAGGDLAWMRAQMDADAATRAREATALAEMLRALDRLPKPLIGRVHGDAYGGGVGLVSVCDTAIGREGLRMALTEVRLGLIPATIGPYVIARIGAAAARRVFFSGRPFDASEAIRLGLLSETVPGEALDAAVERELAPWLAAAPGAVAEGKALVRRLGPRIDEAVIAETVEALVRRWESAEAAEGVAAFFARRPPPWA